MRMSVLPGQEPRWMNVHFIDEVGNVTKGFVSPRQAEFGS
jgi:hypothetical protein